MTLGERCDEIVALIDAVLGEPPAARAMLEGGTDSLGVAPKAEPTIASA